MWKAFTNEKAAWGLIRMYYFALKLISRKDPLKDRNFKKLLFTVLRREKHWFEPTSIYSLFSLDGIKANLTHHNGDKNPEDNEKEKTAIELLTLAIFCLLKLDKSFDFKGLDWHLRHLKDYLDPEVTKNETENHIEKIIDRLIDMISNLSLKDKKKILESILEKFYLILNDKHKAKIKQLLNIPEPESPMPKKRKTEAM